MTIEDRIQFILAHLEEKLGVIAFSYKAYNEDRSYSWRLICIDDYSVYMNNPLFKKLVKAYDVLNRRLFREKIIFCAQTATEEFLVKKMEEKNLLMNL